MLIWHKLATYCYFRFLNSLASSISQTYSNHDSTSFLASSIVLATLET